MSLAEQTIYGWSYGASFRLTADEWAALREELLELGRFRAAMEALKRFKVEGGATAEDAQIWLTCDSGDEYLAVIDGAIALDELVQRAAGHAEECK